MTTNTFSSLAAHIRNHNMIPTPSLPTSLLQFKNPRLAASAAVAVALALSVPAALSRAAESYRGYLALGPGGMPYNVVGWAIQGALGLIARRDTRDPAPFADAANRKPYEPHGSRSFLVLGGGGDDVRPIPAREGDRPVVPEYVAPQRQTTQLGGGPFSGAELRDRMGAYLGTLAGRNPGSVKLAPSGLEGAGTPALWLVRDVDGGAAGGQPPLPPYLRSTRGEMAHVHPEGSSHVVLSMADAGELVAKGWAERHRLAGVLGTVPWGYVIVYAPRDEAEFEVWKAVVAAAVRFGCAGVGKEVVVE